jgi:hypothetical protein
VSAFNPVENVAQFRQDRRTPAVSAVDVDPCPNSFAIAASSATGSMLVVEVVPTVGATQPRLESRRHVSLQR